MLMEKRFKVGALAFQDQGTLGEGKHTVEVVIQSSDKCQRNWFSWRHFGEEGECIFFFFLFKVCGYW